MGKPDQVSSIFWLVLGVLVVYGSYRLGLGALNKPGPGFLPFWSGIILCGLSVLVFIQGRLAQQAGEGMLLSRLWVGMRWQKPLYIIIAIMAYALAFTSIGFILATTLLLIFLFKGIEPETWTWAIVGAVSTSVISYLLFGIWLQVQLPRSFLEELLF